MGSLELAQPLVIRQELLVQYIVLVPWWLALLATGCLWLLCCCRLQPRDLDSVKTLILPSGAAVSVPHGSYTRRDLRPRHPERRG